MKQQQLNPQPAYEAKPTDTTLMFGDDGDDAMNGMNEREEDENNKIYFRHSHAKP